MAKRSWSNEGIDQESMKERDEAKGKKYSGGAPRQGYIRNDVAMYIPAVGQQGEKTLNQVRIVQPLEIKDLKYYGFDVHFHRDVGIDNAMYLCLKRMFGKACPICELQTSELWDSDPDIAKKYYPDWRVLMWVLDLKEEDEEKLGQVLLWSCPRSLAEEILGQSHKPGTGVYLDVSHPTKGRAVFFSRSGKGIQTEYTSVQVDDEELELSEDLLDQMLTFLEVLITPTYAEVKAAHDGYSQQQLEPEEPEVAGDEFDTMDRLALKGYIDEGNLSIRSRKDWSDDDLRDAIREVVGPANRGEEEPPPDCYKKEYDQLDECGEGCRWDGACGKDRVEPDGNTPHISANSTGGRARKPARGTEDKDTKDTSISDVKAKLKAAIKKRQQGIK